MKYGPTCNENTLDISSCDEMCATEYLGEMDVEAFAQLIDRLYRRGLYVSVFGENLHTDGRRRSTSLLHGELQFRSWTPARWSRDWQEKIIDVRGKVYNSRRAAMQMYNWLRASGPTYVAIYHPGPRDILIHI